MKWIYRIYEKEQRLDRLVDELLAIEKNLQHQIAQKDRELEALRKELVTLPATRVGRIADTLGRARDWIFWGKPLRDRAEPAERPVV